MRACLLAKGGRGVVFLDGSDPDDERRISLAHEVAHFLSDYIEPRRRVLALFGEAAREVLDGRRQPTPEERLRGVLAGVVLGTFTHLMARSPDGDIERLEILDAEDRADRLALELLAPRATVLDRLEKQGLRWSSASAFEVAKGMLVHQFGLPAAVADRYGRMLVIGRRGFRTLREWLGT